MLLYLEIILGILGSGSLELGIDQREDKKRK